MEMCGRYFFMWDDSAETKWLHRSLAQQQLPAYTCGEIFPSQPALLLRLVNGAVCADVMNWGMPAYDGHTIINARIETLTQRRMFAACISRRCLLPCQWFFEWKQRQKHYLRMQAEPVYYLAGIYNERREFVILTQPANAAAAAIHKRMPVMIRPDDKEAYLYEGNISKVEIRLQITREEKRACIEQIGFEW